MPLKQAKGAQAQAQKKLRAAEDDVRKAKARRGRGGCSTFSLT